MARNAYAIALSVGLLVLTSGGGFLAAPSDRIPVTATFRCTGGAPVFTANPPSPCGPDDRVAGDNVNAGEYQGVPTGRKTPLQNAYITSDGQFWFAQQAGSGRSVFFDLSAPRDDLPVLPYPLVRDFDTAWSTAFEPNWTASPINVANGLWGMTPEMGTTAGTLKINFSTGFNTYRWTLRFNAVNYPGSTNLSMRCTSHDGSRCNGWTIEAAASEVALLEASTLSGKSIKYDEGLYHLPFAMYLTYP